MSQSVGTVTFPIFELGRRIGDDPSKTILINSTGPDSLLIRLIEDGAVLSFDIPTDLFLAALEQLGIIPSITSLEERAREADRLQASADRVFEMLRQEHNLLEQARTELSARGQH